MFRIIVILLFRGINALRRGKITQYNRNCLCYGAMLIALIYYNYIIHSAINTAKGILSRQVALEDLFQNTENQIIDYNFEPDEPVEAKLPIAYIIGGKRCGTLALADFLSIHPDVILVEKELHYFDDHFSNGIDWYKSNMPQAKKYEIVVERCTSYFTNPAVPERIFKTRPDAKIILGVRDPIERAVSEWAELEKKETASGKFYKPFREFAFEQGNLGKLNENWTALQTGMYAKHLKPWLKYFPRRQIYIYTAEDLAANPAKILRDLQILLQVRYYVNEAHFKLNGTGAFPCILDPRDPEKVCLNETLRATNLKHPALEWSIMHHLKMLLRPHMKDFQNMTGIGYSWA